MKTSRYCRFARILAIGWLALTSSNLLLAQQVEPLEICFGKPAVSVPDWLRSEVIYEVNVRQFSESGTFAAVEADLPRIRDLGVGVLWFMPIQPIGVKNRKGPLGSYYAVKDYTDTNPEYGTAADFERLVEKAHALGLRVVLDWVANHTAWDNHWASEHPDYYAKNEAGEFVPPFGFDWTDVIQLDYTNQALWNAQIDAMLFWMRGAKVDGFRCDYATGVPTAFWNEVGRRLRTEKSDVFLLAEAEVPQHQLHGFNSSYAFSMMVAMNEVAAGRAGASHLDDILAGTKVRFPDAASLIYYTTNHDENSWQGTVYERLGGGVETFGLLSFMFDGVPLIYNGQEAGLDKRLAFFERDPIVWRAHPLAKFYRTLCELRRSNRAMHTGARFERMATTANDKVYAVLREAGSRRVVAMLNLTGEAVKFDVAHSELAGTWRDVFTGESSTFAVGASVELPAWGYRLMTRDQ